MCIDYRGLNIVSLSNAYSLPLIKDLLQETSKGKVFTKLDLCKAYHRVHIREGDEHKMAFNCHLGMFAFSVLLFGLAGAPGVFMNLINEVLRDYLHQGVIVYLDDILIYSETLEDHIPLVRRVLLALEANSLFVKLSRCEFHKTELSFWGYRISGEGISMDPEKVVAV